MNNDFTKDKNACNSSKLLCSYHSDYGMVYPYTTENIAAYIPNVLGKDILSVVGSGDHYLNFVQAGAKKVDSFDINKFAIHFLNLKKAAVKALTLDELYLFLNFDGETFYPRVREYIDKKSLQFWDYYMYLFIHFNGFLDSRLFYPRVTVGDYARRNLYLNSKGYKLLKSRIDDRNNDEVFHGDVFSLVDIIDNKYDKIFLSNINTYQTDYARYRELLDKMLNNNLKDEGELFCGYYYCGEGGDLKYLQRHFDNSQIIEVPSIYNKGSKIDKVLVLKK